MRRIFMLFIGIVASVSLMFGLTSTAEAASSVSVQNKSSKCNIVVGKSLDTRRTIKKGLTRTATSKTGSGTRILLAKGDRVTVTQRGSGDYIQSFRANSYGFYSIASARTGTKAINIRRTGRC